MTGRDERIRAEATALWQEVYGQPPPIVAEGGEMLEQILRNLPDASYERLTSPYLPRGSITWASRD